MQSTIADQQIFERTNAYNTLDAAAQVALAATADVKWAIDQITYGYDAVPTGGFVEIKETSTTVFKVPIVDSGPGVIYFPKSFVGGAGLAITINLADPGGAINSFLNVQYH